MQAWLPQSARTVLLVVSFVALPPCSAATPEVPPLPGPAPLVVRLTEAHLDHLLVAAWREGGGPHFSGHRGSSSRGISDVRYEAELTAPELRLGADATAHLHFEIRSAQVRVGSIERRLAGLMTRCENIGVDLDPAAPVPVDVDLRFVIADGDLRVVPESLAMGDREEDWRLVAPSRCRYPLLPGRVLWWLGKPLLRHRLETLDRMLFDRAGRAAAALNEGDGLLRERWRVSTFGEPERVAELALEPRMLATDGGALLVRMARPGSGALATDAAGDAWSDPAGGSFVAISVPFLDGVLGASFGADSEVRRRPSGNFRRLTRSSSLYTLIPGLRDLDVEDDLEFGFRFRVPPRLTLETAASGAPLLRLSLENAEVSLRRAGESTPLGVLEVREAQVVVTPYPSPLGGVSFEIVENDWRLASRGIEFNEDVLAATLQEMVFGEMFETRYDPLARGGLAVGDAGLEPAGFRSAGEYLVIDLAAR